MVICVESFIGEEGGREGVKLEEQVIIGDKSVERMSTLPFETHWL
ncbi:MAG: aminopeptidase P family protein, partial [Gammaproteobacteria bacterium]|nr:aminopeptidase P family protein [Gammaproteobacteria bacterium]